jgi:hypothetical protein
MGFVEVTDTFRIDPILEETPLRREIKKPIVFREIGLSKNLTA